MTTEERKAWWEANRKKREGEGWVITKLRSTDPSWSPEHPGDFMKGDWGWTFRPVEKLAQVQPVVSSQKRQSHIANASVTF